MSNATQSSSFAVTVSASVSAGITAASQGLGQWYGVPASVYGSTYTGWRDAWKNSLRTMLRWARADISSATSSGGYYSGINKSGSESGPTAAGYANGLLNTTASIGGVPYGSGGNWPANRVIYFNSPSPFIIGQTVVLSTSGGQYQTAKVLASGAASPGGTAAIGLDQIYTGPLNLSAITVYGFSWQPTQRTQLSTLFPTGVGTNFDSASVGPSSPWADTGQTYGTMRDTCNDTASYLMKVRDKYSTTEVIAMYPAYPNLQGDDATPNTGWSFTVATSAASTTVQQVSGYPFCRQRIAFVGATPPTTAMNSVLVNTNGASVSNVSISKVAGDINNYVAEFDSIFTTTSTPPWCVIVCEYAPPVGSNLYRNRGFNDLQKAYMDVAAEAEFAWYVSVVPPITTLTNTDLNPSGATYSLHPNNLGQQKWATYVQSWLAANSYTYWNGPLPAGRPYNGSTSRLGSRMGYY
jgi:hypothetical protein